jgi:hypothetical protein
MTAGLNWNLVDDIRQLLSWRVGNWRGGFDRL